MARTASTYSPDSTIEGVAPQDVVDDCIEARHIGDGEVLAAALASDAVESAKIKDSNITEAKLGSATASGITTGPVACKVIASAELELLLDTNENTLFALKAGDLVLEVGLIVGTAAGAACTVNIGPDATLRTAGKDVNGFAAAFDANAAAGYSTNDATYTGAVLTAGAFIADADGNVLIESSSDQSASAFVGWLYMYYIPA